MIQNIQIYLLQNFVFLSCVIVGIIDKWYTFMYNILYT